MNLAQEFLTRLAREPAVLVTMDSVQGSGPREVGAWMAVFAQGEVGTIGGGHLEFQAQQQAREGLRGEALVPLRRFALGPSLGQCCGGVVHLRFEQVGPADAASLHTRLAAARAPLALFGGGHVGRALIEVLGRLPFELLWVDSRDDIFPDQLPDNVRCEHSEPVQAAVRDLAPGSRVLIMSFSHAEDLDVVAACLQRLRERADLPFIGLIGSKTKWAAFRHRLRERGFSEAECARVTCPIGLPGIGGKQPEVIAVSVAAQLLQTL
ncbi:xanthine dehydrogenase accessory protein XdhC [Ramlibacter sp. 2FC]|uniref:xanthine dehydrogenase accessory protein XdhC n=1 Tax=Ramlibacter sp. 2FC TaxID=2502188 RepID=UPI0010F67894|nr:xanthine dehydrogenase accessory protein XdhC [Ramlibacter sp. 2FC]